MKVCSQSHTVTLEIHVFFQAAGAQDLPRECQNPGVPALWMETTTMDTTEMNLLGALQAVAPLLEVSGVAVTGVEEAA